MLTIAGLMPRPTAEHVGGSVRRGEAKIPSSSKGKNLQIIPQAANARLLSYRTLNDESVMNYPTRLVTSKQETLVLRFRNKERTKGSL